MHFLLKHAIDRCQPRMASIVTQAVAEQAAFCGSHRQVDPLTSPITVLEAGHRVARLCRMECEAINDTLQVCSRLVTHNADA